MAVRHKIPSIRSRGAHEYSPCSSSKYGTFHKNLCSLAKNKASLLTIYIQIVLGSSHSSLLTVVHCTENVLMTGGVMKVLDTREDGQGRGRAAACEQARIVPLDPRWIALLRYHLGTGFEDFCIPGESTIDPVAPPIKKCGTLIISPFH